MNTMEQKGNTLIPAIAYGDAAGLPVETQTAGYIEEKYGRIEHLMPTSENTYFSGEHAPGTWSDDTQLTMAVAKALIKANGFDMRAMVESHIEAYDATEEIFRKGKMIKRGWGGSTTDAMEKLKAGVSPIESGTYNGSGNGVLMKMAPLAYWQVARGTSDAERYAQYDAITNMTHDSATSRLTTRIHGDMLKHLIGNGYNSDAFIEELQSSIAKHESDTRAGGEVSEILSYLPDVKNRNDILQKTDAKGFYAPQTLAMAYGAFMVNEGQFKNSVYEAVNLGGDTDSTGSIVASMSVLVAPHEVLLPADHYELDQLHSLERTSRQLASKALRLA